MSRRASAERLFRPKKWPNCLVSEGAWGRISGLRARVTTLTLVPRALAWFFPLPIPVSAPHLVDDREDHPPAGPLELPVAVLISGPVPQHSMYLRSRFHWSIR